MTTGSSFPVARNIINRDQDEDQWRTTPVHCFENPRRRPCTFRNMEKMATYLFERTSSPARSMANADEDGEISLLGTVRPARWMETAHAVGQGSTVKCHLCNAETACALARVLQQTLSG